MVHVDDAAVVAHRESVRSLVAPGGVLDPLGPYATMNNPAWFRPVTGFTPERRALHQRLLDNYRAQYPNVRQDRRAIVLAGPPGAGKSTVLDRILASRAEQWLRIDADEFKRGLLTEAIRDGSYESVIKPPEVIKRERAGKKFYPLELASLVHEESSVLASRLREEAIGYSVNIIVDTVLSNPQKAQALGQKLAAAGYEVTVIDVEASSEVSAQRIAHRWRQSYEMALGGSDDLGGRWVPSEYARGVFDGPDGRSRSEESARLLAQTCPTVMRYQIYRVTHVTATPELDVDLQRAIKGAKLGGATSNEVLTMEHS
jgi:predicted ABC-type ATPase